MKLPFNLDLSGKCAVVTGAGGVLCSDFAKAISFTVKDDSAYGFIDNFLISIFETGSKKSFFVYYKLDETATNDNDTPISIMTISGCLEKIFTKYCKEGRDGS